jgi:phage shock protein C
MKEVKKLYRSRTNRMVSGLCGGLGEYIGLDPTIVRVIVTILTIVFAGVPAGIYLILIMVIPEEPKPATEKIGEANNQTSEGSQ